MQQAIRQVERHLRTGLCLAIVSIGFIGCSTTACPGFDPSRSARVHGLEHLQVDISTTTIAVQERAYPGDVCFADALEATMHALRFDARDPESAAALLAEHGHRWLTHPRSRLTLAPPSKPSPRGDRTRDWWMFVLHMPSLSDHQFWVAVQRRRNRRGQLVVYSVGVN